MPTATEPRTRADIDVPDLSGKRAVVTGASDGIGVAIALRLARAGAEVLLPVRSAAKGEAATARIRAASPRRRSPSGSWTSPRSHRLRAWPTRCSPTASRSTC